LTVGPAQLNYREHGKELTIQEFFFAIDVHNGVLASAMLRHCKRIFSGAGEVSKHSRACKVNIMKRILLVALAGLSLGAGVVALADTLKDRQDLTAVHNHVQDAIKEMEHASAANHYDMEGHAKKAEQFLREAERELYFAVDSAKAAH
jgi:hypothetical protein